MSVARRAVWTVFVLSLVFCKGFMLTVRFQIIKILLSALDAEFTVALELLGMESESSVFLMKHIPDELLFHAMY